MKKLILIYMIVISIIATSNSATLDCKWIGELCTLPSITAVTQPNEAITVNLKPTNYINTATTSLTFSSFVIKYIPVNLFSIFTNLKTFGISSCGIVSLSTDSFNNCNYLENIQIDNHLNLTSIPEGFAQKCLNTKVILLRNDGIETVDKNAFKSLTKLQRLEINNNKISCLHPDTFQSTPAVQAIYLQYNKITVIDQNLFRNLPYLQAVDLSYNSISYLPPLLLAGSPINQVTFTFYVNPISAIKPDFCSTFANRPATMTDSINIKGVPCLPTGSTFNSITQQNCQASVSILQGCYSRWTSVMSVSAQCEVTPICIPPALYAKFLEFLKTNPV